MVKTGCATGKVTQKPRWDAANGTVVLAERTQIRSCPTGIVFNYTGSGSGAFESITVSLPIRLTATGRYTFKENLTLNFSGNSGTTNGGRCLNKTGHLPPDYQCEIYSLAQLEVYSAIYDSTNRTWYLGTWDTPLSHFQYNTTSRINGLVNTSSRIYGGTGPFSINTSFNETVWPYQEHWPLDSSHVYYLNLTVYARTWSWSFGWPSTVWYRNSTAWAAIDMSNPSGSLRLNSVSMN